MINSHRSAEMPAGGFLLLQGWPLAFSLLPAGAFFIALLLRKRYNKILGIIV